MIRRCLVVIFMWFAAYPAAAQDMASLVADRISVDPSGRLTATGNVEVFYRGTRLTARSVTYTRDGDILTIEGPIRVTEPDGTVLTAAAAELDRDLSDGVLRSARLVLNQQLQLAANEISRVGDRYTRLNRVVASSCEVCAARPTPLWEIRAGSVIHDTEERQLYFSNAQIRVAGIPVFYIPRLRLPDPTLERARGFLIPRFRTSSDLGTGIKLPYFVPIGDHADVTLTPYLSSSTRTVELAFRQNLRRGRVNAIGALTDDDIDGARGYLFADVAYRLPRGFLLNGQLELASDPGYLFTYDYSGKDRLTNQINVTRVRSKDVFRTSITEFRTLRDSEIAIRDTLPDRLVDVFYLRKVPELSFGGRTTISVEALTLNRPSATDVVGRDVSRIGTEIDWRKDRVFGPGLVAVGELGARLDVYNVGQDSNFATTQSRFAPRAAAELRWPFARTMANGAREVLEPVLRIDVADSGGTDVPLEDSSVIEFDEANLFSHTRYPGVDGIEDGVRVAAGLAWRRDDPAGWTLDAAMGRIAHLDGDLGFGVGSGLSGDQSEWLVAARFAMADRLFLANRSLFDENIDFTLSETRIDWQASDFSLGSSYIFAVPEPAEGRLDRLSEWSFDGSYDLNDRWTASANWRYDFKTGRAARTGVGLDYRSECIDVSLSLTRRYADSTAVDPTTDFGFRVSLVGVGGNDGAPRRSRSCRG
ncbi:MAG: LPS-assembly protein LptD [Silicimonas sp.]|nr:LPS-assembly protein LptD [Silicimonas sp.]